jgi:hypothetical protein
LNVPEIGVRWKVNSEWYLAEFLAAKTSDKPFAVAVLVRRLGSTQMSRMTAQSLIDVV